MQKQRCDRKCDLKPFQDMRKIRQSMNQIKRHLHMVSSGKVIVKVCIKMVHTEDAIVKQIWSIKIDQQ